MLAAVQGCMHELQMPHVKFVPCHKFDGIDGTLWRPSIDLKVNYLVFSSLLNLWLLAILRSLATAGLK